MVFIKVYDGRQEIIGYLIKGSHLIRGDRNLHIAQMSDDWLELRIIYSVQGLYNFQIICDCLFFHNGLLYWRKMLLIRQIYMVQQRTFTRQKSA